MSKTGGSAAPLVSVTLAAYNVSPFLADCLDSILSQSFRDFELIVVDDASSDDTRRILQDYALRDPRIRLILKNTNEGLAVARNEAIEAATGKWVTFLDADDLYDPEMLRSAVTLAEAEQAEMVLWDYVVFTDPEEIASKAKEPSAMEQIDAQDRRALLNRPAFAWTRLVSAEALTRLQIRFAVGLTYQDVPVHWALVTQLDRIALLPRRFSFYRQQPQATTAGKGLKRADYFAVLDLVETSLQQNGHWASYRDVLTARQLNAWHGVYDVIAAEHRPHVDDLITARFSQRHESYLTGGQDLRWQARAFFRARQGDKLSALRLWTWRAARAVFRRLRSGG